jgi:hypothetical protein
MMLPGASAPPAVGVKVNVAATPAVPATRSTPATANDTFVTLPPITPDGKDADAVWSTLVCSVTLPPAVGVLLIARPASVTVTAVLAESVAPAVVMMMEVAPGAAMGPREAPPETKPVGVTVVAKKLVG